MSSRSSLPACPGNCSAHPGKPGTVGSYVQTPGPRLETRAEVRALAAGADLVGMTVASEATLARETGMEIAALCTVDNYAHGIADESPTYEHLLERSAEYKDRTGDMVRRIIAGLA